MSQTGKEPLTYLCYPLTVISPSQRPVSLDTATPFTHYHCLTPLNLYDSPALERLATQAAAGRRLQIISTSSEAASSNAVSVCLCEDDYPGWVAIDDLAHLEVTTPYQVALLSEAQIRSRVTAAIDFAHHAMTQSNVYLWGGTIGPDYDCSGLVQTAFASVGIWLPRDAYQQEAFTQPIALSDLLPGDLIFFGPPAKATHVALYLGDDSYIHSSGKDQGRNGIGIDRLTGGDSVSQTYQAQLRGAGRVVAVYQPQQQS